MLLYLAVLSNFLMTDVTQMPFVDIQKDENASDLILLRLTIKLIPVEIVNNQNCFAVIFNLIVCLKRD